MAALAVCPVSPAFPQDALQQEPAVSAPIVFFDLAGQASTQLADFYSSLFGWAVTPDGRFTAHVLSPPMVASSEYERAYGGFSTQVSAPLGGQIRQDPSEKRLYIGVPDVAAALEAIAAQGGVVEAPRFEVPGVVVLGLFKDPAGNAMGLIEMDGQRVKIP
jgi:predicted enzyme related to lactoylglutathione lyase